MPNSYVNYTATSGQTVFGPVSFTGGNALSLSHVKAYVNGNLVTATVSGPLTGPTVTLSSGASAGNTVTIRRETPYTESTRLVAFSDGDVLTAADLNISSLSSLYAAQEAIDKSAEISSNVSGAVASFNGRAGIVIPQANDYTSTMVLHTPSFTSASSRTAASKLDDIFSVKDFGAVGDGIVDDTTAFTTAASSAGTRNVYVPGGSYKITGTVTGNFYSDSPVTVVTGTVNSIKNIVSGQASTADIADDAITAAKLRDDASTDANRAVTTNHIRNGAVTSAKLDTNITVSGTMTSTTASATTVEAQNLSLNAGYGSIAPVFGCRAWVNFNGTAASNLSGTYSQSGTTVTVTATSHGLLQNSQVYVDITSGTAVDGIYTVATVAGPNTFTYTAGTSLTTSGNCTLIRNTIRGSGNVSSISDNGTGNYSINFSSAMVDANYAITGTAWNTVGIVAVMPVEVTTGGCRVLLRGGTNVLQDSELVSIAIVR